MFVQLVIISISTFNFPCISDWESVFKWVLRPLSGAKKGSSFYHHEHDDFSTARTDRFWRPGRGTDWSGDGKSESVEPYEQ